MEDQVSSQNPAQLEDMLSNGGQDLLRRGLSQVNEGERGVDTISQDFTVA